MCRSIAFLVLFSPALALGVTLLNQSDKAVYVAVYDVRGGTDDADSDEKSFLAGEKVVYEIGVRQKQKIVIPAKKSISRSKFSLKTRHYAQELYFSYDKSLLKEEVKKKELHARGSSLGFQAFSDKNEAYVVYNLWGKLRLRKESLEKVADQANCVPPAMEVKPVKVLSVEQKLLMDYTPLYYLSNKENNFPILAEDIFHRQGFKYILGGENLSEEVKIADIPGKDQKGLRFYIPEGFRGGRCLQQSLDSHGNITTPAYGLIVKKDEGEDGKKLFIQYLSFYAFNASYENVKKLPVEKLRKMANAHDFDLEHLTLEFKQRDESNYDFVRMYFGAHGKEDGMWLKEGERRGKRELRFHGTHPIVYVGKGGHGNYPPPAGVEVRFGGFANDFYDQGFLWAPELVQIFLDSEEGFDPETMGWLYHNGDKLGRHGVDSPHKQSWFANPDADQDKGGNSKHFCLSPKFLDAYGYNKCLIKNIHGTIPLKKP